MERHSAIERWLINLHFKSSAINLRYSFSTITLCFRVSTYNPSGHSPLVIHSPCPPPGYSPLRRSAFTENRQRCCSGLESDVYSLQYMISTLLIYKKRISRWRQTTSTTPRYNQLLTRRDVIAGDTIAMVVIATVAAALRHPLVLYLSLG